MWKARQIILGGVTEQDIYQEKERDNENNGLMKEIYKFVDVIYLPR